MSEEVQGTDLHFEDREVEEPEFQAWDMETVKNVLIGACMKHRSTFGIQVKQGKHGMINLPKSSDCYTARCRSGCPLRVVDKMCMNLDCLEVKNVKEFNPDPNFPDGLAPICKECEAKMDEEQLDV